ncbi:MAG: A24 family peptidase, partial [Minisyncoccales bacterium]
VFAADWRWYLIPDGALITGLIAVLALRAGALAQDFFLFGRPDFAALADPLSAAAFAGGLFLAMFLASRGKWMGFGDVKLAFLMGLALGFWPVLLAVFLANLFGAIMGLVMVSAKKKKMSSPIPFGPFLVAGLLISLFFAPAILDWYLLAG